MSKRFWSRFTLIVLLAFFYLPILVTVIFSFNGSRSLTHWSGFSWQWYQRLFVSRDVFEALRTSILLAMISTPISLVLGSITSIGLARKSSFFKKVILSLNNFPVLNPEIVTAISLMLLILSVKWFIPGLEKGFLTLLLAHIIFFYPLCNFDCFACHRIFR